MQDVSMGGLDQDDMYDRQIRLWGHNAQEKMKNSKVLLINLTNSMCELARHLVHAGINITLHPGSRPIVQPEDPKQNFFFKEEDVGSPVAAVLKRYFKQMNPFVQIETASEDDLTQDIDEFDAVVVGIHPIFSEDQPETFSDILSICSRTHDVGVPFYCIEAIGKYAAMFVDVGEEFPYEEESTMKVEEIGDEQEEDVNTDQNMSENIPQPTAPQKQFEEKVIEDSITFSEFIEQWSQNTKINDPSTLRRDLKRLKNPAINAFLALNLARITSPTVLLEKGISTHNNSVMTGLLESRQFKSRMDTPLEEEELKEETPTQENALQEGEEEEKKENPLNESLAGEVMKMLGDASDEVKTLMSDKETEEILQKMAEWQGIDVNMIATVIGPLASQEIVKVVTGRGEPFRGLLVYSMESSQTVEVGAGDWK